MADMVSWLNDRRCQVVGSLGSAADLKALSLSLARASCDLVEVRLDLILSEIGSSPPAWSHLRGVPLLFTARRIEEGGGAAMDAETRMKHLLTTLDDAACVDIEVASIHEMRPLIDRLTQQNIPWIASFHDFEKLPSMETLAHAAKAARNAGAAAFKVAAQMNTPEDLAGLARFQLADHGLPIATMGMGALAPVSRLLCAQCGSVLNYGFLGENPTAPGQWDAASLKQAITKLAPFRA